MLEPFRNKVEWRDSLQPFVGVHFSNELLDALPVRLISGGVEKLVDLQDDMFVFIERPPSNMVFNQVALDGIDNLAANLNRGYVIAIDYGHWGDEFQRDIQVRAQHRHLDSPFEQIGHADIAWVIGSEWQHQGYATEAVKVVVGFLLELGVQEIRASIHPDHVASIRVAERVGFMRTNERAGPEVIWKLISE